MYSIQEKSDGTLVAQEHSAYRHLVYTKTKPYQHQLDTFQRIKDKPYFALFMDMGTGKTKVSIDTANYQHRQKIIDRVLVIAPNGVHQQWEREIEKHSGSEYDVFVWHSTKNAEKYSQALESFLTRRTGKLKWFLVNVESFQWSKVLPYVGRFVKGGTPLTIVDEATRIKTPSAKRSKQIQKLNKYGVRGILTGTPTAKSPFDLWSQFEFLEHDYFKCNYFIFQHRYGIMMKQQNRASGKYYHAPIDQKTWSMAKSAIKKMRERRGGNLYPDDYASLSALTSITEDNIKFIDESEQITLYKRMDELRSKIEPVTVSIKKEDCLDLPEKIYEPMFVQLSPEQKKLYKNMAAQMYAEYGEQELSVTNKMVLALRLSQICGGFFPYQPDLELNEYKVKMIEGKNPKIERMIEDLEEVDDDRQVIVWARFVSELKMLDSELKKIGTTALYYGDVSWDDREKAINDFTEGRVRFFIANPDSAGFGLNLQNATIQYWYSNSFRTENRLQAEDRSHRIGTVQHCVYKDIICSGTVDERVYEVISQGRDLNEFFMETSLNDLLKLD